MINSTKSPSRSDCLPQSGGMMFWLWWPVGGILLSLPFLIDSLWPSVIVGLMAWLRGLEAAPKRQFWRGYLGGFVFVYLSLVWMFALSPVIHAITALIFGLYIGVFALITEKIHGKLGVQLWVIAPAGIILVETLVEHVTIFSVTWLHLGYILWRFPHPMQLAEVGGITMLSSLLMLVSSVLYHVGRTLQCDGKVVFRRRSFWVPIGVISAALIATIGYGTIRLNQLGLQPSMRVALVQANIPQALRSRGEGAQPVIAKHATMTMQGLDREVDLVVWPESSVGYFIETNENISTYLGELANAITTPLLIGSIGYNEPPEPPSNSAFVIEKEGWLGDRTDKHILVPFAETLPVVRHIPPLHRAISDLLSRTMGFRPYLSAGAEPELVRVGERRVGVLICYDDAVPGPSATLQRKGAEALFTLSNEAWFAEGELAQHVAMATVRCIETRLPMARATHTGETCIIDPSGRINARLPSNQEGILCGTLESSGISVIPSWVRLAFSCGVSCAVLALFVMAHWHRFGTQK